MASPLIRTSPTAVSTGSSGRRRLAEARGRRAERLACWWLRLKGWRLLAERVRVNGGEVDLVMRRGKTLAFIEVKQRATVHAADWALDRQRLTRVAVAARLLAPRFRSGCNIIRIDAVLIVPGHLPRHLEHVWFG